MIDSVGGVTAGTALVRVQTEDFRRYVVIFVIKIGSRDDELLHSAPVTAEK